MNKTYFLILLFGLLLGNARGQDAGIRVEGVKSIFVGVATPEVQQSRIALHSGDGGNVHFLVKDPDSSLLYCLGANNRVCFFSLRPGAQVHITIDERGFRFSGDGAERNNRFCRLSEKLFYSLPNEWLNDYMSTLFCTEFLTSDSLVLCNENYMTQIRQLFDECTAEVGQWTQESLETRKCWRQRLQRMYWDAVVSTFRTLRYNRWPRPERLLKTMDKMPFADTDYMLSQEGRVRTYNFLLAQEELGHFSFTPETFLAEKARCIPNAKVREEYILRELERWINGQEVLFLDATLNSCRKEIKSPDTKKRYRELSRKAQLLLEKDTLNSIFVQFEFEDPNGHKVSSGQFKGKYLYIDIWATWCAPCKQEMPYMQQLEKEYGGGKIVFVSLSSDRLKDKDKWLAYLKEHQMEGVTLIASDGLNNPFIRQFGVTGIPRFMLIGPDGKMISHNCWRPSDPRMKVLLQKLSREK